MGWITQAVIATLVIIEGPDGGLFVYSGKPAAGNLIASITQTADPDEFGNIPRPVIATYDSAGAFLQLLDNIISIGSGSGDLNPGTLSGGGGALSVSSGKHTGSPDTPMGMLLSSALLSISGTDPQLCLAAGVPVPGTSSMLEVQGKVSLLGELFIGDLSAGGQAVFVPFTAGIDLEFNLGTATVYSQVGFIGASEAAGSGGQFGQIQIVAPKRQAHPDLISLTLASSDSSSPSNVQLTYTDTGGTGHLYLDVDNTGANLTGTAIGVIPGITPARQDSWNDLGTPAGWTVTVARYVASGVANGIWIDIMVTAPSGGATSVTFPNALPAAYRPSANRIYPCAINSATAANARVSVGSNGSVQIVGLPSGFTGSAGASFLLATN